MGAINTERIKCFEELPYFEGEDGGFIKIGTKGDISGAQAISIA